MTALQDWLGIRPVDQSALVELVCRPFRAVLGMADSPGAEEFTTMCAGIERC